MLCCTWDTIQATPAIRLLACDLCDANEDSLRPFKKGCAVSVPRKRSRNVLPLWRWTRDEKILQRLRKAVELEIDTRARMHFVQHLSLICRGKLTRLRSTADAEVHAAVMGLKELPHVHWLLTWI